VRGLIGLVIVGALVIVGGIYLGTRGPNSEDQYSVAVASGQTPGGAYEIHIGVEFAMTRTESPKLKGPGSTWPEWVEEHFKLVDASGKKVALARTNNSRLIKSQGTWDFYLSAPAKPGETYELTYQPRRDEPLCFRQKFTTAREGKASSRLMLDKVK
jgi:hypothetical protein